MVFRKNNNQQIDFINDKVFSLSDRERKRLLETWPGFFSEVIFPAINEKRFAPLYSTDTGRPNTPVNYIFGALLLKELFSLTDEEVKDSLLFDIRYQHALRSTSLQEQPVSDRMFSRFRVANEKYTLIEDRDLIHEEIDSLTKHLEQFFQLVPTKKRMNSMMIASNTKKLSRLELLYVCIEKVVHTIDQQYPNISLDGFKQYLESDHQNQVTYYDQAPYNERLQTLVKDGYTLIDTFNDELGEDEDFQLLCRALHDQSEKDEDGNISVKKGQEIKPDSLQTPHDPDATYRTKAGKSHVGYSVNFVETVDESLALITHYDFDVNTQSDVHFGYKAIEEMGVQKHPADLVADGAYDSDKVRNIAKVNGFNLTTTQLIGRKPNLLHAGIILDEENETVVQCPGGNQPIRTSYYPDTDTYRAVFTKESAQKCDCGVCSIHEQKKTTYVTTTPKMIQRAKQAQDMEDESFLEHTHFRNGVEGIPSVFRRKYDVDHIPARGRLRLKQFLDFKVGAFNIKRAEKVYQEQ